jgi:serine/threonine-protein kinase RsbW
MTDGSPPARGNPGVVPGSAVLLQRPISAETVTGLRHAVTAQVAAAGLSGDAADDFVLAVHELVTNAVRHGGGSGRLELRLIGDSLVCEVVDHGGWSDDLPVRLSHADVPGGRGLWIAHRLTQGLMLTRLPDGVTASVSVCLTSPAAPPNPKTTDPAGGNGDASPPGSQQS